MSNSHKDIKKQIFDYLNSQTKQKHNHEDMGMGGNYTWGSIELNRLWYRLPYKNENRKTNFCIELEKLLGFEFDFDERIKELYPDKVETTKDKISKSMAKDSCFTEENSPNQSEERHGIDLLNQAYRSEIERIDEKVTSLSLKMNSVEKILRGFMWKIIQSDEKIEEEIKEYFQLKEKLK